MQKRSLQAIKKLEPQKAWERGYPDTGHETSNVVPRPFLVGSLVMNEQRKSYV